ncbi:MAG: hypothetical protein Q8R26_01505 [bacterium]|nr:hypothetical protein [bacterium]
MKLRQEVKSGIILILAIAGLYAGGHFLITRVLVPEEFTAARKESATIAKDIVGLTDSSLKNLSTIGVHDRNYNFGLALTMVREELERVKEPRAKAIELTEELGIMAQTAFQILPTKARNLAMEGIGHEVALITHLIVYNDVLNSLLQTLQFKFSGDIRYDAQDVQEIIKNMNEEVQQINELNEQFNQVMREFDEIVAE